MLGAVETEAVSTGIDTLLQEVQHIALNLVGAGVQVGHAAHAVLGDAEAVAAGIVLIGGILGVVMPCGCILADVGRDHSGQGVAGHMVSHVVGDHVDDDLDAVLLSLGAHGGKLRSGADGVALDSVDDEINRLILDPPHAVHILAGGVFLNRLDGGGLHSGITLGSDQRQVLLDGVEGPVPCMEGGAILDAGVILVADIAAADIAELDGIVSVDNQGEGHLNAAGHCQLVKGVALGLEVLIHSGIVQDTGADHTVPALGHVPVLVVSGLDGNIAVDSEGSGQLAIDELVLADVGVVIAFAVGRTVDVAEQVVIALGDGIGGSRIGGDGIRRLAGVLSGGVAQGHSAVVIDHQGQGDGTGRNHQLVSGRVQIDGVVQGDGSHSTLPAVGHVPIGVVAGLDSHIADLAEGSGDLTVHELVLAQVVGIFLTAVVGTVDVAKQVEVLINRDGGGRIGGNRIGGIGFIGSDLDGAPGSAALVPSAFLDGVAVGAVGGNLQVGSLVPLVVPVVGCGSGRHSAEDDVCEAVGNGNFVVATLNSHCVHPLGSAGAVPEIGRIAGVALGPLVTGFQVNLAGCSSRGNHRDHADDHADQQQDTEQFFRTVFHCNPPSFLRIGRYDPARLYLPSHQFYYKGINNKNPVLLLFSLDEFPHVIASENAVFLSTLTILFSLDLWLSGQSIIISRWKLPGAPP